MSFLMRPYAPAVSGARAGEKMLIVGDAQERRAVRLTMLSFITGVSPSRHTPSVSMRRHRAPALSPLRFDRHILMFE